MPNSREAYLARLTRATALCAVFALALYAMAPARWFSFYGWATILLAATGLFSHALVKRLAETGQRRAWALLVIVPGALIGLIQIGYWLAFFHFGPATPVPGVLRGLFWINAGFAVPWAASALAAVWLWLFVKAARDQP